MNNIKQSPAADLLEQARRRIVSDPARAEKHRAIYVTLWPLVFADTLCGERRP